MQVKKGPAARFVGTGTLVLFLCWQHVQATRLGYQVEAARKKALEGRGRVDALRIQIDELLSPEQVVTRATRLGLVPATPDALRQLAPTSCTEPLGTLARFWTHGLAPLVAASRS